MGVNAVYYKGIHYFITFVSQSSNILMKNINEFNESTFFP